MARTRKSPKELSFVRSATPTGHRSSRELAFPTSTDPHQKGHSACPRQSFSPPIPAALPQADVNSPSHSASACRSDASKSLTSLASSKRRCFRSRRSGRKSGRELRSLDKGHRRQEASRLRRSRQSRRIRRSSLPAIRRRGVRASPSPHRSLRHNRGMNRLPWRGRAHVFARDPLPRPRDRLSAPQAKAVARGRAPSVADAQSQDETQ